MKRTLNIAQLLVAVAVSTIIGVGQVTADDAVPATEQRVIVIARAAVPARELAQHVEQTPTTDKAVKAAIEAVAEDNRELLEIRLTDHILVDSSAAR